MMHLVGDAVPGDFVTFDAKSNFKVLSPLDISIANAASAIAGPPDFDTAGDAAIATAITNGVNAAVDALRDALRWLKLTQLVGQT